MSTYSVQCWCEFISKIFFIFVVRFQFKEWKYFKILISASLKMFLKLQLFVIKLPNVTSIYTKRISSHNLVSPSPVSPMYSPFDVEHIKLKLTHVRSLYAEHTGLVV